jgi:light-regulated signal transduction histidine kinase (bacteriophytochrome)
MLSLVALGCLWRRRRSVLDLWLMVVMSVWVFDIALASVLNAGRYDVGWYFGRVYGLLAASFVLMVLLLENSMLYGRLVAAHEGERRERRRAEEKSAELLAVNRELDAFSFSVSHDLRGPLRAVNGFTRMLEEDYHDKLDAEGRRLLGVVRESSVKMGRMIEDLLAFSRMGRHPLKTAKVKLDRLVNQAIYELGARSDGRRIEFTVGELGAVEADASLLKHALTNLLSNAAKYSRNRDPALVEVGRLAEASGNGCTYFVKDNGAGFDMRGADKLFGVFQRLHRAEDFEGTGVGLAIVKRVIERHGGRVWAESAPDQGATFYFTLGAATESETGPSV